MITEVPDQHGSLRGCHAAADAFAELTQLSLLRGQQRHPADLCRRAIVATIGRELIMTENRPLRHGLRDLESRMSSRSPRRHKRSKGTGLRLPHPFHGMTHCLTNGIERQVVLLAQADEEQTFRRHLTLRVIDQYFPSSPFELF